MNKLLIRRKERLPLLQRIIRGSIGKDYVIKHYSYGAIRTRFPDMSRIIASEQQKKCRQLFKEAVAYAKIACKDPEIRSGIQKRIRHKSGVFTYLVKEYMLRAKRKKELDRALVNRLLYKAMHKPGKPDNCEMLPVHKRRYDPFAPQTMIPDTG